MSDVDGIVPSVLFSLIDLNGNRIQLHL